MIATSWGVTTNEQLAPAGLPLWHVGARGTRRARALRGIPRRKADHPSPPRHRGRLHLLHLLAARCACGTSGTAPDATAARPGELLDNAHHPRQSIASPG